MTKKVVLKLGVHDEKEKKKALKAVSSLTGIESLAMDMKDKKLTVVGEVDPVEIVGKLKKSCHCYAELLTVGPAKEPEKKKEEPKKVEPKKIEELLQLYKTYYPQTYRVYSVEENPNSCVIC